VDSAIVEPDRIANYEDFIGKLTTRLSTGWAAAFYVAFGILIYWPVLIGKRFFWEDFFIQEYPIREFCFYMVRFQHQLPFWNPYSWAWSPLLSDAQAGFWYPGNLMGIAVTWLLSPHSMHLPVIVPEVFTLLHLPLAALGVFVLLKNEFRISPLAALVAGLTWGFGVRMVAEQNHSMQIIQLALLPWETLLLMRSWRSWRHAIWLGLVFGISFLAGQPQTFLYVAIFLSSFTLAEVLRRRNTGHSVSQPAVNLTLAMVIALGIACIQLLPSMELVGLSARKHMDFGEASTGGLHLGHIINMFVPKYYGEYPGFNIPFSDIVNDHFWYWEATFYWGALSEILALLAIVRRWRTRNRLEPVSQFLTFFLVFSVLALAYGMGKNLYFQWPFWRYLPFFDSIRAPNRMVWFVWFLGSIMTGIGLNDLLHFPDLLTKHKKFFLWTGALFVLANVLAITGVIDYLFKPHILRHGLLTFLLPSLVISLCVFYYLFLGTKNKIARQRIFLFGALLICIDLYYNDFTWHRNTVNRENIVAEDSSSTIVQQFRQLHADRSKLLLLYKGETRGQKANLGMFIRLPIEYANNDTDLSDINPLRLSPCIPSIKDSNKRMALMGVSTARAAGTSKEYSNALPFLMLYHDWRVAHDKEAETILNDSIFDFRKTVILEEKPQLAHGQANSNDSTQLLAYSENYLKAHVSSAQPSILLVNDLYYPAWEATVDGKEVKILKAFESLRAIPLPPGSHLVEMRYDDAAFNTGWKITLGTLVLSILTLIVTRKQKGPDFSEPLRV